MPKMCSCCDPGYEVCFASAKHAPQRSRTSDIHAYNNALIRLLFLMEHTNLSLFGLAISGLLFLTKDTFVKDPQVYPNVSVLDFLYKRCYDKVESRRKTVWQYEW